MVWPFVTIIQYISPYHYCGHTLVWNVISLAMFNLLMATRRLWPHTYTGTQPTFTVFADSDLLQIYVLHWLAHIIKMQKLVYTRWYRYYRQPLWAIIQFLVILIKSVIRVTLPSCYAQKLLVASCVSIQLAGKLIIIAWNNIQCYDNLHKYNILLVMNRQQDIAVMVVFFTLIQCFK